MSTNGRDNSFLPVPRSSDCENYVRKYCETRWIRRGIVMSIGDGMSLSDAIGCFRKRLDFYDQQNAISEPDTLSDSDDIGDKVGIEVVSRNQYLVLPNLLHL